MLAVIAEEFCAPEGLRLVETADPTPGPGQVKIAIEAAGVSFVDALITAGKYQLKPKLPYIPGTEFSGTVVEVGEGVTSHQIGDKVCASNFGGGFATKIVLAASAALNIPANLSLIEASVFRVSFTTAYYALVQRGRLQAGEWVLVLGAGGAVGSAACQVARALRARVIGLGSSAQKRALARESGAGHVIDPTQEDWRAQIQSLTDGQGVDVIVDPVGGPLADTAFRTIGWGGRHLVIGFAAGAIPRLPLNLPLLKGAEVVGVDIRQFSEKHPALAADNVQALFDLHAKGALRPIIGRVFAFAEFKEALQAAADGSVAGRVVLSVSAAS